jgi:amidohydrolase
LLFQPSEEAQDREGKSGGMRMVEEGALKGVDAVFGLHVDAQHDVGHVATRSGPMMAAADMFKLIIRGSGGHAARPQSTVDPIALSAHVINAVQQVVSRRLNPTEPGVITIGTIHGGTVNNVIPDTVEMTGTIRSFSPAARQLLRDELTKAVRVVEPLGGAAELKIYPGYPPVVNDDTATAVMFDAMGKLLGENNVVQSDLIMGAEDFAYMAQEAPGCFLRLGVHSPAWAEHYPVHRADFRMDEDALPIGSAALVAAALAWMEQKG